MEQFVTENIGKRRDRPLEGEVVDQLTWQYFFGIFEARPSGNPFEFIVGIDVYLAAVL